MGKGVAIQAIAKNVDYGTLNTSLHICPSEYAQVHLKTAHISDSSTSLDWFCTLSKAIVLPYCARQPQSWAWKDGAGCMIDFIRAGFHYQRRSTLRYSTEQTHPSDHGVTNHRLVQNWFSRSPSPFQLFWTVLSTLAQHFHPEETMSRFHVSA